MDDFHEITTSEEPNCIDQLNGVPLKNGEKLELIWPDYAHTLETIHVKSWKNKTKDGIILHQKAHVILIWKTIPAKIRIVGLKARRMK